MLLFGNISRKIELSKVSFSFDVTVDENIVNDGFFSLR